MSLSLFRIGLYLALGALLASMGYHVSNWQYWACMGLMLIMSLASSNNK